ncbi:hypothetical protein Zmor_000718 [Zophobas morio]|uniref:Uncharacterized protein n=1 Tax=Zophobas morio TaxID=2755281 RepID=A0AA38MRM6_9CUCU|nr:hypothetical protein Zmor_000718 [Zophobas morio]
MRCTVEDQGAAIYEGSVLTSVGDVVTTTSFTAVGPGPSAHMGTASATAARFSTEGQQESQEWTFKDEGRAAGWGFPCVRLGDKAFSKKKTKWTVADLECRVLEERWKKFNLRLRCVLTTLRGLKK